MIQNTFQHLKHIGANTEKKLWQKGVFNWNDYINYKHFQNMLPGLPSELAEIQESLDALNAGDSAYFAERLHPHEFYRVALLIFQLFTKQYLAKLLHCMAWNYQAAKQKTFGSTGDCGQWNFLKAE